MGRNDFLYDFRKTLNGRRKMKKYIVAVVLLSITLVTMPASASTYVCSGTITYLGLGGNGVAVGGPGGMPIIFACKVDAMSANGYTPEVCKATYAMLLAAKLSGQPVQIEFSDNLTCATQPVWTSSTTLVFVFSTP